MTRRQRRRWAREARLLRRWRRWVGRDKDVTSIFHGINQAPKAPLHTRRAFRRFARIMMDESVTMLHEFKDVQGWKLSPSTAG